MHGFRDGDERRRAPSSPRQSERSAGSAARWEEIGDLHFHAASYGSAVDYYRSALREFADHDAHHGPVVLSLHTKLADCFRLQGMFPEADAELASAAHLIDGDAVARAALDVRLARIRQAQGRFDDASGLARRAFVVLSVTDRHSDVAGAQMVLGITHACTGQLAKAEEFFQDALATYRRIDDVVSQAHVLNNLALLAKRACRWTRALQLYDRAEQLFQTHGATYESNALLLNKAVLHRKMGRRAEATAVALRGLKLARSRGDQADLCRLSLLMGQLNVEGRRFVEAEQCLLEAKVLAERQEMNRELALADEFLGDLMCATGRPDEAATNYELAEERARAISASNDVLTEVRRRRAELALSRGDLAEATELAASGLQLVATSGEEYERGFLLRVRGAALARLGELEEGLRSFEEAVDVFRRLRLGRELTDTLMQTALVHLEAGREEHALRARARLREALGVEDVEGVVDVCALHVALVRAELVLGNHDEALIALFEVERLRCHGDAHFDDGVDVLRREIESGMADRASRSTSALQMLADLPDLVEDEEDFAHGEALVRVLRATVQRLGADRGAVLLRSGRGRLEVLAAHCMTRAIARELGAHAMRLLSEDEAGRPRVWSQTSRDPQWSDLCDADRGPRATAVAFAVRDPEAAVEGVFFFDADARAGRALPFDGEALALANSSVEILRSALLRSVREERGLRVDRRFEGPFARVVTQSARVMDVLELCTKVAASPYTVLFSGETGTGKGLLARLVHDLSPRANGPFVVVNCAAIPEALLESELFGHTKGSFTGADRTEQGLILSASGGTLFLDEIGKMPLPMQAKLLHFLDDKQLRPVGGTRNMQVDVRVLCATRRNLEQMVQREEFLEDLYYRLLDFPIVVPPLRERGEDVLLLADTFVERTCRELERARPSLTRTFTARLRAHQWPGNVRELEKVIRRAVLLAGEEARLKEQHLPEIVRGREPAGTGGDDSTVERRPLKERVAELEREIIAKCLDELQWNRAEAARQLRISYPTLLQKIRLYGLSPLS
jgi:Nif-specific regulatory protein